MRHRPCCLRRGDAVATSRSPCALGACPIRATPQKRARGTPDARCARSLVCDGLSLDTRDSVTTKASDTSGVPHAMVFSACFVLSPANGRNLSPSGLSCTVRPLSDRMVSCGPHGRQALHPFDGTTRLEPTREAMSVGRISAPAASHSVVVSRRSGLLGSAFRRSNTPPQEESVLAPGLAPSRPYAPA
jgi:hypothetical protein